LLALLFASSEAAQAQSLGERDKRAVIEARKATPLTVRHAMFVDAPPNVYADPVERMDKAFRKGDKLITYGASIRLEGDRQWLYRSCFNVDFLVKTADGKVNGWP
jgi:hypothetical protein